MSSAVISEDQRYRYSLARSWQGDGERVLFIMLNPSVADAEQDDPTILRCCSFAKLWGYRHLEVVNLFAFRSTDPKRMYQEPDPVGPRNDDFIYGHAKSADRIFVAWGKLPVAAVSREAKVLGLLEEFELWCVGRTKEGFPRHPLYVARLTIPTVWRSRVRMS